MDEYEKYSAEAADVSLSDFHAEQFIQFLEGDLTAEDIKEMYNNEELRDFWEDFRFRYREYGDDRETMLEALKDEKANRATKAKRDQQNRAAKLRPGERRRKSGSPEYGREKIPLPEPKISRTGRGGNKPPRESTNPVIRIVGRIGRRLFGRDK